MQPVAPDAPSQGSLLFAVCQPTALNYSALKWSGTQLNLSLKGLLCSAQCALTCSPLHEFNFFRQIIHLSLFIESTLIFQELWNPQPSAMSPKWTCSRARWIKVGSDQSSCSRVQFDQKGTIMLPQSASVDVVEKGLGTVEGDETQKITGTFWDEKGLRVK